jgi:single-strand DNA-binding protein
MEVTGRLTNDAEVRKTNGGKELVAFTVAVNDTYKAKDGEVKEFTEYINCSYWLSTKIADSLSKGSIVTVTGRIYLNEYKDKEGNHHANLAFHANAIKIIARGGKKGGSTAQATSAAQKGTPETVDDLPF